MPTAVIRRAQLNPVSTFLTTLPFVALPRSIISELLPRCGARERFDARRLDSATGWQYCSLLDYSRIQKMHNEMLHGAYFSLLQPHFEKTAQCFARANPQHQALLFLLTPSA